MGLSRRAYAALRGVHESAVRKAIATGRIMTRVQHPSLSCDGRISVLRSEDTTSCSTMQSAEPHPRPQP